MKNKKPGRDLIIRLRLVSAGFRSRHLSHVMLAMRLVTLFSLLLLSFIPSPSPLFTAKFSSQVIRGRGKELHIGKEWWWCGNLWDQIISLEQAAIYIYFFSSDLLSKFDFTFLIEEEEARSMRGGHVFWHVADFQIVDETPEEEQETCGGEGQLFISTWWTHSQQYSANCLHHWSCTHQATGRSTRASIDR